MVDFQYQKRTSPDFNIYMTVITVSGLYYRTEDFVAYQCMEATLYLLSLIYQFIF